MSYMKRCLMFLVVVLPISLLILPPAGHAAATPKETAFAAIDRNKDEIAKVGDVIYSFAELGMQEIETSKLCIDLLKGMGYKVETGISGMPTAIMATYVSGKPVIAVHIEYDAVPSGSQTSGVTERREIVKGAPGHAEGHNTNAAVWIGAAYAVKEAIDKHNLKGTVKLFSAPGEEQLVSRPFFVRDGYFKDVDAAFHAHVGETLSTSYGIRQYGIVSVAYELFGKTAHSAVAPWTGASALDAAKLMDIGWDVLREHLPPTQRSHSVIVNGGVQPNVVPDYAKIWFFFRESTYEGANNLYVKAKKIAEGAAMMTGTTWKENVMSACWPTRDNQTMAELVQSNIELVGIPKWTDEEQALAKRIQKMVGAKETGLATKISPLRQASQGTSSNDSGDITWTVPHGRITMPTNVGGVPGHHWAATIAVATSIAHKGEVVGAKVLAGSMVDLLAKPELLAKAKETFKKEMAGATYKPLLPPDQKPPLTLNVEEMAKYRDEMKKHYLHPNIQFK
ncbi:MAG: amidohydrolase [Deltaproteobacteria bacterium]